MACVEIQKLFITILIICTAVLLLVYLFIPADLKILNRPVWHSSKQLIDYELEGEGTSQQVVDIYSFSHITHGILFYFILKYFGFNESSIVYLTILKESAWELVENTSFIKKRYRNYKGDSIVNNIGDIMFTVFGVYFACTTPAGAILYAILSEIILAQYGANFLHLSVGSLL